MLSERANEAAIYDLYLYLANKSTPLEHSQLRFIVNDLNATRARQKPKPWSPREIYRLNILNNALERFPSLGKSVIGDRIISESGSTTCTFTNNSGGVYVLFRGTGDGEWLDNGEGLSGIPRENTYITYDKGGAPIARNVIKNDFATQSQTEALNRFNYLAAKNGWGKDTPITVSGHSKGGNKAQFITMHSDIVDECYSFDGQGFSPEAIAQFKERSGSKHEERRRKISSISADDDYVSVLGLPIAPEEQIYYLESYYGLHYMEAILDEDGCLRPESEQGSLSRYVESVSKELMNISPSLRKYTTLGVMNIFQRYLGDDPNENLNGVSTGEVIAGLGVAIGPLLRGLGRR